MAGDMQEALDVNSSLSRTDQNTTRRCLPMAHKQRQVVTTANVTACAQGNIALKH